MRMHPSTLRGWKDALAGKQPRRDYKRAKQQQAYNKGYSLGTRARNHSYAQKLRDIFGE